MAHGRRWRRIFTVILAAALIIFSFALGAAKIAQLRLANHVATPPGRLVDSGGRNLHLDCRGDNTRGQPTIVLEAGLGESSLTWAGVLPTLAETYRVCAYDRAGYGWSEPAATPPHATAIITDLHTLLQRANEPGPYLLVGHSLGGLYARLFAQRYPAETAGLLLLDPSHEEMTSRLPADWQQYIRQVNAQAASDLRIPALLADTGVLALFPQLAPVDPRLPADTQATVRALSGANGNGFRALAAEIAASEAILGEARTARIIDLGDLPLLVVTAGITPDSIVPAGLRPFTPTYDLHQELAAQSTQGQRVVLNTTHYVQYDAPAQVITAINMLVKKIESVQKGGAPSLQIVRPSSRQASRRRGMQARRVVSGWLVAGQVRSR
jgi:pimeloyl-ACP methyl ester carboxylesterase